MGERDDDLDAIDARRNALLKASAPTRSDPQASIDASEDNRLAIGRLLEPPYDPLALGTLLEHSNALRQNVDAYCTNIDGFGHRFEPAFDLSADDADGRIGECILIERLADAREDRGSIPDPTPDEIASRKAELVRLARVERAQLESFFSQCALDQSFVQLRRATRFDLEVTGNAYWEVLRNNRGEIARLVYVPSHTMRLMPLETEAVEVEEPFRISPITVGRAPVVRRFRKFVQIQLGVTVCFKQLGDPRVVSRRTGAVFQSVEALRAARSDDAPATEILHFAIHSPGSAYGVPRWIGAMLSVLGSREMEEVNYTYFQNKSVPPLALLVSGGRLADGTAARIERFLEENIKGKRNFHRVLVVEAESQGTQTSPEARARIEMQPLTDAQQKDALFANYDERNIDKVGSSFRLPRLLRGDSREMNRSTSESALRFAEDQVFAPERDEFDYVINRRLLGAMGIRFWRFRSQTPVTRDPERMTAMVEKLVRVGVLTPEEGRVLAGDIFNRELPKLNADWTKRPITLTLAGIQSGQENVRAPATPAPGVAFDPPSATSTETTASES